MAEVFRTGDRAATIQGLRELADFLEAHPSLPVEYSTRVNAFTTDDLDEDTARAAVDDVAGVMGVFSKDWGHYTAEKQFGPVEYAVVHISTEQRRSYEARHSYADCVQPDAIPSASAEVA